MPIVVNVNVQFASVDDIRFFKDALANLNNLGVKIMATLADVKAAIAKLAEDAAAEKLEVSTAIQALKDQIKGLQDQITSGTGVTAADLDALVASLTDIDASVKDITTPGDIPAVAPV